MIPLHKFDPLVDMFNEVVPTEITDFQLARIRRELNSFSKTASYHDIQVFEGMYAVLTHDIDAIKKHFNAAIKHTGNLHPETKFNYAASLSNVYDFIGAVEICDEIIDQYSDDIDALKEILEIYVNAYASDKALNVLHRLSKLGQDKDFIEDYETQLATRQTILSETNLKWTEIAAEVARLAQNINKAKRKRILSTSESFSEELSSIFVRFVFDADSQTIIEIDDYITDLVADRPYSEIDDIFTFSCASKQS